MNPIQNALTDDVDNGRVPLGRLFVEAGLLSDSQVDDVLNESSQTGERIGEIAVRRGMISEEDLARTLAQQWNLSYVDRASIFFDAGALARLSREDAQRLEAMPTRVQDGRVVVAVAEPTEARLHALREVIGEDTVMVVVPRAALDAALSSELLSSRTAFEGRASEPEPPATPAFELLQAIEPVPQPAYREIPRIPEPSRAPIAFNESEPPPFSAEPGSEGEVDALRARVLQLEAELAQQRATAFEVQRYLQAALRRLYS
jgi:Type II secretion system (T2SS), protein E, N-terminal domain